MQKTSPNSLGTLRATVVLIMAVLAARLLFLWLVCPFSLVEDEAHYWDWSRHLDWSYYTKGPGIALVIAASTRLLGHSEFGVRAFMPLFGAVFMAAAAALGARAGGRRFSSLTEVDARRAFASAAVVALVPIFQGLGILSTIDGPYCACWAVAALAGQRALMGRSRLGWIVMGLAIGAGFLFKYTILLLVPGLLMFAFTAGASRAVCRRWPVWLAVATAVALLGMAPVLIWNMKNGWPTIAHLLGHLGFAEPSGKGTPQMGAGPGRGWSPLWLLEYVGTQIGFVGPALALGAIGMVRSWSAVRSAERDAHVDDFAPAGWFMACCALPILVFYLIVSLITEPEGNWSVAAYVTLAPLAGCVAADGMAEYRARVRKWLETPAGLRKREGFLRRKPETGPQMAWHMTVAVGVVMAVSTVAVSLLPRMAGRLPEWMTKTIPISRLTQARDMGAAAEILRGELKNQTGREPRIVGQHYGRASQLAFYLKGQPIVYCSNSWQGGRLTAQDFWPDSQLDAPELVGENFLIVGGNELEWGPDFVTLVPKGLLAGVERKGVHAFLGYGFRGIVPAMNPLPANPAPTIQPPPAADKSPQ